MPVQINAQYQHSRRELLGTQVAELAGYTSLSRPESESVPLVQSILQKLVIEEGQTPTSGRVERRRGVSSVVFGDTNGLGLREGIDCGAPLAYLFIGSPIVTSATTQLAVYNTLVDLASTNHELHRLWVSLPALISRIGGEGDDALREECSLEHLVDTVINLGQPDMGRHYKHVHFRSLEPASWATQPVTLDAIATALSDPITFDPLFQPKAIFDAQAYWLFAFLWILPNWQMGRPAHLALPIHEHHRGIRKSVCDLIRWDVPTPQDARRYSQPKQTVFADTMEAKEIEVAKSSVPSQGESQDSLFTFSYLTRAHTPFATSFVDTAPTGAATGADSKVAMVVNSLKNRPIRSERVCESRSSGAATGRRTVKFAMLKDMQLVDLDSSISKTPTQLVELDAIATALFDLAIFEAHHGPRAANAPALRAPPDALRSQARRPLCLAATVRRHHWGIWYVTVAQIERWVIGGE
ncbi:hypothetical protein EDB83DRAFT_2318782 [Lactarius deliciosus]|nr:hypothetical protein EDB83DRAFT_2318782 [Lactarius deliciosus]